MKYLGEEISEIHDLALIQAVKKMDAQLAERAKAASHQKFDKNNSKNVGSFPPPNPAFLEIKEALENEMTKRKLTKE